MRIHLSRQGRSEFLTLLRENGVAFDEMRPRPGMIVAAGETIEIIGALGPPLIGAIAFVLGKWLKVRASQRVILTLKDRQIRHFDAQGYSQDEMSALLANAASLTVVETSSGPDEPETRR